MAPPRTHTHKPPRPGRALLVLALLLLCLTAAAFTAGQTTPKLGLDLAGGTTVTLKAVTPNGHTPPADQMDESVRIMNDRVNGFGVSEPLVTRQGSDVIVVQLPGKGHQRLVSLINQTAKLQFRQVYAVRTPAPPQAPSTIKGPDAPTIAQFATADCTKPETTIQGAADDRKPWVVACDKSAKAAYLLGPVRVRGEQIKSAQAIPPDPQQNRPTWTVGLTFKSKGADQFYNLTGDAYRAYQQDPRSPQRLLAIVLDGQVASAPENTNGPIGGGQVSIYGPPDTFTPQYAHDLASVLSYGALPLDFKRGTEESVSPQLGGDQLRAGLEAGGIGLALVVLYCLVYYRRLGWVAVCSLAVSGALTYLGVVLLGHLIDFRLTLAGITGLIVAIGVTADSFVVYFERLRDEEREGHSRRVAAVRGWARARRTVLVADAVAFLCASVLYLVSVGSVQGFAFALGLTTLIDIVVVFLFTRPLVGLITRRAA